MIFGFGGACIRKFSAKVHEPACRQAGNYGERRISLKRKPLRERAVNRSARRKFSARGGKGENLMVASKGNSTKAEKNDRFTKYIER